MFGYEAADMVGIPLTALMPERFRAAHLAGFGRFVQSGEGRFLGRTVEVAGLRKDGSEFPVELSLASWTSLGGVYSTGVVRDISERKAAEEERRKREAMERTLEEQKRLEEDRSRLLAVEQEARRDAEQANRAKNEFLAVLSHELRTPLSSIVGWAHMLKDAQLDAEQTASAVQTIIRNADTQTRLIADILDVSRIVSGKLHLNLRVVDLAEIVRAAREVLSPAADARRIEVEMSLAAEALPTMGDPERLQQIVWNLLSNAVKFTPEGGKVEVALKSAGDHTTITVSDNGPGIAPAFLPFVFDSFRQGDASTTRRHGGLGLGLAIARHLAELHGGTVSAANRAEGSGAVFTLALPRSRAPLPEQMAPAEAGAGAGGANPWGPHSLSGVRALVVDDEADSRDFAAAVLRSAHAEVVSAASSREALQRFKEVRPHVLLVDLGMPEEDGYAFLEKVRTLSYERGGFVPAAAVTAYAAPEDRLAALRAGFQVHIAKPVAPGDLIAAVANLAGVTRKNPAGEA
jgi:PAS domain S-box-containing protein